MTEAQKLAAAILEDDGAEFNDILPDIVRKSLTKWKLEKLSGADISNARFGFSIHTSTEDDINVRAEELKMPLTDASWVQLNADIMKLEQNATTILRDNGIQCNPEGHGDDDLVGSAWMKAVVSDGYMIPTQAALKLMLYAHDNLISTYSGSIEDFDPNRKLWEGVSDLGQSLVDVSISFFDTEKLELDHWEDILGEHPELWSGVQEAKQYLDFNTIMGPPEERPVHVKEVNGVPIFSVKCPGCKRLHGNFRTFDEASGNRMCKYCTRDYVDAITKANETGNYKPLTKKPDTRKKS